MLHAVERDLRSHYGDRFRIIAADSGDSALEALSELKLRGDSLALLLVDQRMPGMSGVEFVAAALELFPDVKRALLTAYADRHRGGDPRYQRSPDRLLPMKPWDPLAERRA